MPSAHEGPGADKIPQHIDVDSPFPAGHMLRVSRGRITYVAMEWMPGGGRRNRGRPTKIWRKTFKDDLAEMEINWNDVKEIANDSFR